MKEHRIITSADEYQSAARKFAQYGGNETYSVLGLAEEAGEVMGKVAKFIRKHGGATPFAAMRGNLLTEDVAAWRADMLKELGDVMWMVADVATNLDIPLSLVMTANIDKLTDRANRGVIVGEGDNR